MSLTPHAIRGGTRNMNLGDKLLLTLVLAYAIVIADMVYINHYRGITDEKAEEIAWIDFKDSHPDHDQYAYAPVDIEGAINLRQQEKVHYVRILYQKVDYGGEILQKSMGNRTEWKLPGTIKTGSIIYRISNKGNNRTIVPTCVSPWAPELLPPC